MGRWQGFLLSPNISNEDYREASHKEQASIRSWWPWTKTPPIIRSEKAFLRRYYENIESLWWLKRWVRFVNGCEARNQYLDFEIGTKAFDFLAEVGAAVGDTQQGSDLHSETAIRDRTYEAMGSFIRQSMRLRAPTETSSVSKEKSNTKSKPESRIEPLFFIYHPSLKRKSLDRLLPAGAYQYPISGVSNNLNALVLWMQFLNKELLLRERLLKSLPWLLRPKPTEFRFHLLIPSYYELAIKAQLQFPRDLASLTIHGQMGDHQGNPVSNIWLNVPSSTQGLGPLLNGVGNLHELRLPHIQDWIVSMPTSARPIMTRIFGPDTSVQIMLGHDPSQLLYSEPNDDNEGVFSIIDYNN